MSSQLDFQLLNPYLDLFKKLGETGPVFLAEIRRKVIWSYAWAIPDRSAIEALCELGPLLEVGAGSGYWAWMIRQVGGKIIALDHNPEAPPRWTEVQAGGPDRIQEFPGYTLMLCWPPDRSSMASECLAVYEGSSLAFVGEPKGGVTADFPFYEKLERDFVLRRRIEIPRWPGCEDALWIYERK